eukprot:COSAG03_NODE_1658_length_3707_cov_54.710920_3_plen_147_part_00
MAEEGARSSESADAAALVVQAIAMMQMYAAAMAALLVSPACAVPTAGPGLAFEQSLAISSPLSQDGYGAVERELSTTMTRINRVQTIATVVTQSANRRLQSGTMITISYTVACGASCDDISAVRSTLPTHAQTRCLQCCCERGSSG